jgi:dTDP-glucose pyrophosphorylase
MSVNVNNVIESHESVKVALEKLSHAGSRHALTIFVLRNKAVVGSLTDGDVRRGLLSGVSLTDPVEKIMFKGFRHLKKNDYSLDYLNELRKLEIELIPLLNDKNELIRIIDLSKKKSILPLDAIIMAGGEGKRLRPLTIDTPKPLIQLNGKTIIDYNIDRLESYGINHFFVTVNYLKEKIKAHLGDGKSREITIEYIDEEEPLGTIGSASKIKKLSHDTVLLMNSDLLTNIDYEDFYKTFLASKADMAVASSSYQMNVPYGIFELDGDKILTLKEKPTYTYHSNAGIYLIKAGHLKLIPENKHFNATDLMTELIRQKKTVINFPIRGYWLDIGQHEDYLRAQEDIKHIRF